MTIGPEDLGHGSPVTQDRFPGQFAGYRGGGRRDDSNRVEPDLAPRNGSIPHLEPSGSSDRGPRLPSLDLGLTEPVYPGEGWTEQLGNLADHPLLRGLLLELPAKGTLPDAAWLDRWFEAARAILELLYHQDTQLPR